MSIPIFEYLNYREFLRDAYEKKHSEDWHFSHRYIASCARMDASMFNKILQGKRNLTPRLIDVFASLFCDTVEEKEYFINMVAFNQAKTHSDSRLYLERLVAHKECKVHSLAKDQFEYFNHWYHAVVRELLVIYPYSGDARSFGQMIFPPIKASQVKESIALLERLSLIKKNESTGLYEQTEGFVTSGSESYSTEVNHYIQQNLKIACTALDRFNSKERNLSTLVFSCDEESYGEVVEMVRRFRREVLSRISASKKSNRVFQLGIQFFPLSDTYPPPIRRGRKKKISDKEQNNRDMEVDCD
ncbi:MAG TPA: TIGR02147 family protein [Fibrobacteraceae bacterium]|mgnify:CR=1 FL=1|jgi:uncharacterized protein (TIGR02147 family)|nr:TIGR02147 family protein [Fibrobacteraceae bacterium]